MEMIWFLSLLSLAILNVLVFYYYLNRILVCVTSFLNKSDNILLKLDKLVHVLEGLTEENGVLEEISKKMSK